MGESLVGHIPSNENVADLITKVLCEQKRKYMVNNILYFYSLQPSAVSSARKDHNQTSLIPLVIVSNLRRLERCGHGLDLNIKSEMK